MVAGNQKTILLVLIVGQGSPVSQISQPTMITVLLLFWRVRLPYEWELWKARDPRNGKESLIIRDMLNNSVVPFSTKVRTYN